MDRNLDAIDTVSMTLYTAIAQLNCLSMLLSAKDHEVFPSNAVLAATLKGIATTIGVAYKIAEEM